MNLCQNGLFFTFPHEMDMAILISKANRINCGAQFDRVLYSKHFPSKNSSRYSKIVCKFLQIFTSKVICIFHFKIEAPPINSWFDTLPTLQISMQIYKAYLEPKSEKNSIWYGIAMSDLNRINCFFFHENYR